ncbi:MAG: hypothetical protein CME25_16610 [Gemmatimonadetes bacterium]|nr:hypothetical protein [Gemmatimonadota bacterium]
MIPKTLSLFSFVTVFSFAVHASAINVPPTFSSTPVTQALAGALYSYEITTSDADGDTVMVTGETLPDWLALTSWGTGEAAIVSTLASLENISTGYGIDLLPSSLAVDADGNVYFTVTHYAGNQDYNHQIHKISSEGVLTVLAGSAQIGSDDGTGTDASFNWPDGVAVDASGNVYVADGNNYKIRKISPDGVVTTLAGSGQQASTDGTGTGASFAFPRGLAVDASGNVYVADGQYVFNQFKIRKISPDGVVITLAGSGAKASVDGTGGAASFDVPDKVAVDLSGNVYVFDVGSKKIRKVSPDGVVTTLASNLQSSSGMAVDAAGYLYLTEYGNHHIRRINPDGSGTSSEFTGSATGISGFLNGAGTEARFNKPVAVSIDASGKVYVADQDNHAIRKITFAAWSYKLSGTPVFEDAGSHAVVLRAADGKGGVTEQSFNVVVNDENVAPSFTSAPVTEVDARTLYTYAITISDDDGDAIAVTGETLPDWLVLSSNAGYVITGTPVLGDVGLHNVVLKADDGKGGVTEQSFTLTVNSVNFPPVFTSTPPMEVSAGALYTYAITTSDDNGDVVTVTGETLPSWLVLSSDAGYVLAGTPADEDVGDHAVVLRADDGNGGVAEQSFTVTINIPPAFNSMPVTEAESGTLYEYDVTTSDGDGDTVMVTGGTLPDWLALSGEGNLLVGTLTSVENGLIPHSLTRDSEGNIYFVEDEGRQIYKLSAPDFVLTTLAGSGNEGSADGYGTAASFNGLTGIAVDINGNVYVADRDNHLIRKVSPGGAVTKLAGSGQAGEADGTGAAAEFRYPMSVAVDTAGTVYVSDFYSIRKVSPGGVVTTLAGSFPGTGPTVDGTGTAATFRNSGGGGLALGPNGYVYVAETHSDKIRKVSPDGVVTTIVDGSYSGPDDIDTPRDIAIDAVGNIYVIHGDPASDAIMRISSDGVETTVAGFNMPQGVEVDAAGNVYVADEGNKTIGRIASESYVLAGTPAAEDAGDHAVVLRAHDGKGGVTEQSFTVMVNSPPAFNSTAVTEAESGTPYSYAIEVSDGDGDVVTVTGETLPSWLVLSSDAGYVLAGTPADEDVGDHAVVLRADDGNGGVAEQSFTVTINIPPAFNSMPVTEAESGTLYEYDVTTSDGDGDTVMVTGGTLPDWLALSGEGNLLVGTLTSVENGLIPHSLTRDSEGNIYFVEDEGRQIYKLSAPDFVLTTLAGSGNEGSADGYGTAASFNGLTGIAVDINGNVYVADRDNHLIRKVSPGGAVTKLAGSGQAGEADGTGAAAEFRYPMSVAVDTAGTVYVSDFYSIRKVSPGGVVTTLAGSFPGTGPTVDGTGTAATFRNSGGGGLALGPNGYVYVAETHSDKIRKVSPDGVVTTIVDGSYSGPDDIDTPRDIAIDAVGNIYVIHGDPASDAIMRISSDGVETTVAGFNMPQGVEVDAAGNVYVADEGNKTIGRIASESYVLAGTPAAEDAGDHAVVLRAHDGKGGVTEQSFTVTVTGSDVSQEVNVAPAFNSTAVTEAESGTPYNYPIRTSDADGDTITVTGETLPDWLSLSAAQGLVVINEFMASNGETLADPQGAYDDWIELHNPTTSAIDLGGMYLTDDLSSPKKWEFPDTTLSANGYILVWADGDEGATPGLHANFELSGDGEQIGLYDRDDHGNAVVDTLTFGSQESDVSKGRILDGTGSTVTLETATPGLANSPDADSSRAAYVLSGTPADEDIGDHDVVLKAVDGKGGVTEQSFTVTVIFANAVPEFTSMPITDVESDVLYSYTIEVTDADEDEVTVTAETLPDWLVLSSDVGYVLTGTPADEDVGDHDVVLNAVDGKGGVIEQSFTVTVSVYTPTPNFDGVGQVDFSDFLLFASQYGKTIEMDLDFDRRFDLDKNGEIGFGDFIMFALAYGSS